MTLARIFVFGCSIVVTAEAAFGQAAPAAGPTRVVSEGSYPTGAPEPWRRVQTRTQSGGREVVVETHEVPNIDGRMAPFEETIVESTKPAPNTEQVTREVYGFAGDGKRRLLQTTESLRETQPNGDVRTVRQTTAPDLNGRVGWMIRETEESREVAGRRETAHTQAAPDINVPMLEAERTETSERLVNAEPVSRDSTQMVRDINGRWLAVEVRRGETRALAPAERVEEEVVEHLNIDGRLVVDERHVTRRSTANGQDQVTIERHFPVEPGSTRLVVAERVNRSTSATTDGGRSTVEEVQALNPVAPGDPMRLTQRTVTTVQRDGSGRLVTERQVFERDVNGRMQLIMRDTDVEER